MRFYIATGLKNAEAHNAVRDALHALGHRITYDWTAHGGVWEGGIDALEAVAVQETIGVAQADVVIGLLPGGKGTHFELGLAYAAGPKKRIFLFTEKGELFKASPETCAFYHLPGVWKYTCTSVKLQAPRIAQLVHEFPSLGTMWSGSLE